MCRRNSHIIRGDNMKVYIYEILNLINNQCYVGQTTNFSRRKQTHVQKLKNNKHPNPKLQNAWNHYGEENFSFIPYPYEVKDKEELNELEIEWIEKKDSLNNGYNLTEGGQGGLNVSPNKRKLTFEEYCIAYAGNCRYKGLMNKTGRYFNCDSSTISALVNKNAYLDFQEKFHNLAEDERKSFLKEFELIFKENLETTYRGKIDDELAFEILCVVSTYSRGIEAAIISKFNLSKSFVINCFRYNGYKQAKQKLSTLTEQEISQIAKEKFEEWELNKINSYLKVNYKNLFEKYNKYL